MNEDATRALEAMGISLEEALNADEEVKNHIQRGERDGRVCLCGHPVARHTVIGGVVYCKPSRMECPCKKTRPVLESNDTRKFLRRTVGAGAMHALTLGIVSAIQSGKSAEWVVDLKCDRCGADDANVVPVPVTQTGRAATYATGFDALLCPQCRVEV